MARFITILILLALIFFGTITYGESSAIDVANPNIVDTSVEQEVEVIEHVDIIPYELEQNNRNDNSSTIGKLASALERMVGSFYDIIIAFLYGIAGIFFD